MPASGCAADLASRRSRSAISTWRRRLTLTRPSSSSNTPGIVRDGRRLARHASTTARTTAPGAVGIAMIDLVDVAARDDVLEVGERPSTGTP